MKLKHINLLSFAALAGCALALAGCGGSGICGAGMNSAMKNQAVVGDTAEKGYTGKPMPPIQVPVPADQTNAAVNAESPIAPDKNLEPAQAKGGGNERMWWWWLPPPRR